MKGTVYLCPDCGVYEPLTTPDYRGGLSGECAGCNQACREVHAFAVRRIDAECVCHMDHARRDAASRATEDGR